MFDCCVAIWVDYCCSGMNDNFVLLSDRVCLIVVYNLGAILLFWYMNIKSGANLNHRVGFQSGKAMVLVWKATGLDKSRFVDDIEIN